MGDLAAGITGVCSAIGVGAGVGVGAAGGVAGAAERLALGVSTVTQSPGFLAGFSAGAGDSAGGSFICCVFPISSGSLLGTAFGSSDMSSSPKGLNQDLHHYMPDSKF
jgi:hypothetical protein